MSNDPKLKADLMTFLRENGWSRQISKDRQVVRFQMTNAGLDKPVNIYFTEKAGAHHRDRIEVEEALTTVRQFYGIPFAELRHRMDTLARGGSRIGLHPRDFVTSRVPDRYVVDDTIEMQVASSMVAYMKSLVEGAAIAEVELTGSFTNASVRSAKSYVDACRFGHTFRGSFGFQVECPLHEAVQFDMFEVERPLGRKVSQRIALAMEAVTEAFIRDDISRLTQPSLVTARMCADLADFLEETGVSSFNLGVAFDAALAIEERSENPEFEVKAASIPMLREAAQRLEPLPEEQQVNVVGRIIELKAAGIPLAENDDSKRLVTIQWDSDEGRRKVQLELNSQDYADAIRAHENGLHVQVKGTLVRRSRRSSLTETGPFKVLD
ncbi:hypothetical protein [Ensifer sp. ZNC0028]|uniref:hypothetical protein n=1 Tax=Ensifer sp. ZNC0028 TaxID=1339236 RepID=UPI0005B8B8C1|nr:hypothetical protein [Ensifer sp. ZNC0028]